jgi:NHL repeat.
MSVADIFNVRLQLFEFDKIYELVKTACDPLLFQQGVSNLIKILSNISHIVRTKRNIFSEFIPDVLLNNIISFLPREYKFSSLCVSKSWNKKLSKFKNTMPQFTSPIGTKLIKEKKFYNKRTLITNNNEYIFIKGSNYIICYDENLEPKSEYRENFMYYEMATNSSSICHYCNSHVFLRSLNNNNNNFKFKKKWYCSNIVNVIMCEKYLYMSCEEKFKIYNFDGKLMKTWSLKNHDYRHGEKRSIAINNDEIFVVDSFDNIIEVFSYNGKLIRTIGKIDIESRKFRNPKSIAIYNNALYVCDYGNSRIQVLKLCGEFLFEIKLNYKPYNIVCFKDSLFVNYDSTSIISIFKILYDDKKRTINSVKSFSV